MEFAREKSVLCDKWCQASKVTTLENLRELTLFEEFKNWLPEKHTKMFFRHLPLDYQGQPTGH